MSAGCPMEHVRTENQHPQPQQHQQLPKQALPMWLVIVFIIIFLLALIILDSKYKLGIGSFFTGFMQ